MPSPFPSTPPRSRLLPAQGMVQVSTDLHGNGHDFRRLRQLFLQTLTRHPDSHWVLLGDAVHGPDAKARAKYPDLYDFDDESLTIVEGILELQAKHPGQVHYVLGNHDYGHVGGPHTRKFHPDEVEHLEQMAGPAGTALIKQLFEPALLAVLTPCGALLTHGSPNDRIRSLDDLDGYRFPCPWQDEHRSAVLDSFLHSYGQPGPVTSRLLATLSREGYELKFVVHGHDRDEKGYFIEGGNQICPILLGAPLRNKRYLLLDLTKKYRGPLDLLEEREILRLEA